MTSRQTTTSRRRAKEREALLQGTLDLLILRTLLWGPTHGHGIATSIQRDSGGAFIVEHGSLYPALQRLLQQGWVKAAWGVSENRRRARFYRLTAAGRKQWLGESSKWERSVQAISRVLHPAREEQ
jgi:transcriptional regulator